MKSEQYLDLARIIRAYAISFSAVLAVEGNAMPVQISSDLETTYRRLLRVIYNTHLQTPAYAEAYMQDIGGNLTVLCGVRLTEEEYLQTPLVKDFLWKFDSNLCSRCGDAPRQHDSSMCGNCGYLYGVPMSPPVGVYA